MTVTDTMRLAGRTVRHRASVVRHGVKDRLLERRLERAMEENERLRGESALLRDEMKEERSEHEQIVSLLEERTNGHRVHGGRWLLVLTLLAGSAYAAMRLRGNAHGESPSPAHAV